MTQYPYTKFVENATQAIQLLTLHEEKNVDKKTHHAYEVLTKSCVVLLVACWEAFVEDCVESAVDFLVENTESPTKLPKELLKYVAAELRGNKNDLKIWDLAGDGWKKAVRDHYKAMIAKYLGQFNTPRAGNIDELYKVILGIENLSSCWSWKKMSNKSAKDRLNAAITLRGAVAHRVQASKKVTRSLADQYGVHFIFLAIKTSNEVRNYIHRVTGQYPWPEESSNSVK